MVKEFDAINSAWRDYVSNYPLNEYNQSELQFARETYLFVINLTVDYMTKPFQ